MLNELEIRKEIARLEYEEPSYLNYEKLATLYIIRTEMNKARDTEQGIAPNIERRYSTSAESKQARAVGNYGDSDFLLAIADKAPGGVWPIIDELAESLRVMQPRTYAALMHKINAL